LGAALLAGLAEGIFPDLEDIRESWRVDQRFSPDMGQEERGEHLALWKKGIERV
jgi:glycerol kinase